ncbi:MAG: hypothetical protein RL398_2903, partial [Planctomycetota bacterium]
MRLSLGALLAASVLTASAAAQVVIPPHAAVYNGYTRGYNFTAANSFIINQLELPLDAYQAGDTASFYVRVNGANTFYSAGTAGPAVPCSILVSPGDVVDIMGNWSPAAPGTFTAHNSYGNTTPYATTILGVATTLNRTGIQNDIGNPGWVQGTGYLAPTTGQLGRVFMYAVPPTGTYVNFTSDVTGGASPLTVNFTDQTYTSDPGGIVGWAWDFDGDSVIDSTLQNPSFVYNSCGSYDVTLTTVDAGFGANTTTKTAYIVTDRVTADFTYGQIAPGVFQFTDTSSPTPTSWAWDLNGDNVVDDTTQNPVFFYPNPCTGVNVTLTASRLCGAASTKSAQVVISPNTLTAQTTGGNGLSSATSIGMVFDAQVTNPQGVAICAVSMRPYTFTGPFNLSLYVSEGSYLDLVGGVARHTVASAWRLIATGTGVSTGGTSLTSVPALVSLSNTAYVPAGDYCFALMISNPAGTANLAYTTGTAANWGPFADANMVISPNPTVAPGAVKTTLFGATLTSSRIWNGAFHYATHNDDGKANFGYAATGCAGALGVPTLTASGAPQLGSTFTVTAGNLPLSAMILITGFGRQSPAPLDLTAYGAPGCRVAVGIDASNFQLGAANQAVWNLAVPVDPAFSGMTLFNQALALDPAANTLGAVMSDATGM